MSGLYESLPPYGHVIVAIDGSDLCQNALLGGSALAARTYAELHVFHAAPDLSSEAIVTDQAARTLGGVPYRLTIRDLDPQLATAATMIADFAGDVSDSVVVIGTHGRGDIGATVLGSTANELVAWSELPVIVYGPATRSPAGVERVVVCVDGSQLSEASVADGARWAGALRVPLWLVQALQPGISAEIGRQESSYVHNLARDLTGLAAGVEWDVLHSASPANAILDSFGDASTLLVMASHGRIGFRRIVLGSVVGEVVKKALGPVAVRRPAGSIADS